jgi:hypothetical protein
LGLDVAGDSDPLPLLGNAALGFSQYRLTNTASIRWAMKPGHNLDDLHQRHGD